MLGVPEEDLLVVADSRDYLCLGMVGDQDLVTEALAVLGGVESQEEDGLEAHTLAASITALF